MLGELVCATIPKEERVVMVLAGAVLVVGLAMAIPVITASDDKPAVRKGDVGNFEAMKNAEQPTISCSETFLKRAARSRRQTRSAPGNPVP